MHDNNTLLVPIEVKALIVNRQERVSKNYQRFQMNYENLNDYISSEPKPFDNNANDFHSDPKNEGVYLHWLLPEALRHGKEDQDTGQIEFPLVPNRWVVIRYSGDLEQRKATGWVLESDYIDPNQGTSPYIDPSSRQCEPTMIGRKLVLDDAQWEETGSSPLYLRAIGPGSVTFATFQPNVENVFSMHDDLNGVDDVDYLSYLVVGWYSDQREDPLHRWNTLEDYQEVLTSLQWETTDSDITPAKTSLYHGLVCGLKWDKFGEILNPAKDSTKPKIAIGNTSIDALTALIQEQSTEKQMSAIQPNLLEAFQYNLLSSLDQVDGEELLQDKIHSACFGSQSGGVIWKIVDKQLSDPSEKASFNSLKEKKEDEGKWLAELNQAQVKLEEEEKVLQSLQFELYSIWWKYGRAQAILNATGKMPMGCTQEEFEQILDPTNEESLVTKVYKQKKEVQELQLKIPKGSTEEDIQKSIGEYAKNHNLSSERQLKRFMKPRFWKANDPIVLISGLQHSIQLTSRGMLKCRNVEHMIQGFTFAFNDHKYNIDRNTLKDVIPKINLTNLPEYIDGLLKEFFLLDPINSIMIAEAIFHSKDDEVVGQLSKFMQLHERSAFQGILPSNDLNQWHQPWEPLFMEWEVNWYPIQHSADGEDHWKFDGRKYDWTGKGSHAEPQVLSGRTFLTPHTNFSFRSRLEQFLQDNPNVSLKGVEKFIEQVDQWDFLSQMLSGFNEQLALRDLQGSLVPDNSEKLFQNETLATLIGDQCHSVPVPGRYKKIPFKPLPPSNFQGVREGQFAFSRLVVIDRFGQAIEIVSSSNHDSYRPIIAKGLKPKKTVLPVEPSRFIQMPPRLLQESRLNFDFVDSNDDNKIIHLHDQMNPICGWILPNHLDQGLSVYDESGNCLGEICLVESDVQEKIVHWQPVPESQYTTLESLYSKYEHLGKFLMSLQEKGSQEYLNLLKVIDESLWTINPLGNYDDLNLSVLIGRPLAIVRAKIQFELFGQPLSDPSWNKTFNPVRPDFLENNFSLRLGNVNLHQDGLIGYFLNNNYGQFYATHSLVKKNVELLAESPYIQPVGDGNYIGLTFEKESCAYVTMLVDPRGSVHAYSGILPMKSLIIPDEYIDPALKNMNVTFRIGPILTEIQRGMKDKIEDTNQQFERIRLPIPAEKNGIWSWIEQDQSGWVAMETKRTDQNAKLNDSKPTLRMGWLKVSSALEQNKED